MSNVTFTGRGINIKKGNTWIRVNPLESAEPQFWLRKVPVKKK